MFKTVNIVLHFGRGIFKKKMIYELIFSAIESIPVTFLSMNKNEFKIVGWDNLPLLVN